MRLFLIAAGLLGGLALISLGLATSAGNVFGWILVAAGMAYGLGGTIWFALRGSGGIVIREEAGDRSFWLILPGFIAIFFGPPLEFLYLPAWLPRTWAMQFIGMALIVLGLSLRLWTRRALGQMYTGHVQIQAKHRLVRDGPYRYVRHPGYAGFILLAFGFAFGFSSLLGLLSIPALLLPGLIQRMNVEETLLTEAFGDEYREYARTTKRLAPGIW